MSVNACVYAHLYVYTSGSSSLTYSLSFVNKSVYFFKFDHICIGALMMHSFDYFE